MEYLKNIFFIFLSLCSGFGLGLLKLGWWLASNFTGKNKSRSRRSLKSWPRNSILRLRKFIAAVQIIGFVIIYYVKKGLYFLWLTFKDAFILKEIRSFLLVLLFSFFFYYFIVVELSVWVFGYSLLCYWFLFILIMTCVITSWRLEAEFIKDELTFVAMSPVTWVKFYKGWNPLSFYSYLTDYQDFPLFWWVIVWWNAVDLDEGRLMLFTWFFFLVFFFFILVFIVLIRVLLNL